MTGPRKKHRSLSFRMALVLCLSGSYSRSVRWRRLLCIMLFCLDSAVANTHASTSNKTQESVVSGCSAIDTPHTTCFCVYGNISRPSSQLEQTRSRREPPADPPSTMLKEARRKPADSACCRLPEKKRAGAARAALELDRQTRRSGTCC